MQAGRLRHRVRIERHSQSKDASGGVIETWDSLATVAAHVRMQTGGETFADPAGKIQAAVTHKINMRPGAGGVTLTPRDRFVWQGRILEIVSIGDIEGRGRETVIMCHERVEAP